jgi:alcohol dehydrogenase class IV
MDDVPAGELRFLPVERVVFGAGAVRGLPRALDRHGRGRALVITGVTIAEQTDLLWYVEQLLGPRHAATYSGARQHVPWATVGEAVDLARLAGADCLVSLGGGSAIDTAKAVAHRLAAGEGANPGRDGDVAPVPTPLPHFAVPTTLVPAAFTHVAGVTEEETRRRESVADPRLAPVAVFLDPEMTPATPARLWLSTGITAIEHAVERFLGAAHQPFTDALALEAVRLLVTFLPRTHAAPDDLPARLHCQLAAWMALFGAISVPAGLGHLLGRQMAVHCDVPLGLVAGVTLPHILRARGGDPPRLQRLAGAMGVGDPGLEAVAEAVAGLVSRFGLPARLRDAGVPAAELDAIAHAAYPEVVARDLAPPGGPEALAALLRAMW